MKRYIIKGGLRGLPLAGLCGLSMGLLWYVLAPGSALGPLAYAVYALLGYTTYSVAADTVRGARALKSRFRSDNRILTDEEYRSFWITRITLAINAGFALFKCIMGWKLHSVWLGAVGGYYAALAIARFLIIREYRKSSRPADEAARLCRGLSCYRVCGWVLIAMQVALSAAVVQMVTGGASFRYPGYLVYAAGAYAAFNAVFAGIRLARAHRAHHPTLAALRMVSCASALVSILALQTALLSAFSDDGMNVPAWNGATGGVVCAAIFFAGAYMVASGTRDLRKQKEETVNEQPA